MEVFPTAPAYPVGFVPSVKSRSRYAPAVRVKAPVPAETLNEILLASVTAPGVIVRVADVLALTMTKGVPVTVVVVLPINTDPAMVRVVVMLPVVPNAIVFAPAPQLTWTQVKTLLDMSNVPEVNKKLPVLLGSAIGLKSNWVFLTSVSPHPGESTLIWDSRITYPAGESSV